MSISQRAIISIISKLYKDGVKDNWIRCSAPYRSIDLALLRVKNKREKKNQRPSYMSDVYTASYTYRIEPLTVKNIYQQPQVK